MSSGTSWIDSLRLQGIELSLLRRMMAAAPSDAINLALGELAFDFPDILKHKAIELIAEGNPAYTPNAGLAELREAVANYLGYVSGANILICNGAEEALYIALQGILNEGDTVAIPDPDYPAYPTLVSLASAKTIRLPFAEDLVAIDWQLWESLLPGRKALLLSHPSNPTGFRFNAHDFQRLATLLNRHKVILIIDEVYSELYFDHAVNLDFSLVDKVIRIGGVSKSHLMSGWRIGWLASNEQEVIQLSKLKQYISTCAAWLSQKLAFYALQQNSVVEDVRELLSANRALCLDSLSHEVLHLPFVGPYLMLKTDDGTAHAQKLLEQGVITLPGIAFGEISSPYIRINFGVKQEVLSQALKRFL